MTLFHAQKRIMFHKTVAVLFTLTVLVTVVRSAANSGPPKPSTRNRSAYNFGLPYRVTHVVNMTIGFMKGDGVTSQLTSSVQIGLFGQTVPKAASNFATLCSMERGFGYVNSSFHRVLHNFIVQGGDFEKRDGTGGHSIFNDNPGRRFSAENFNIPHREGSVAMASEHKSRLGSQFYFVAASDGDVKFLNGKHVVFGHVVGGFRSTVLKMARVPTSKSDVPKRPLVVTACSVSVHTELPAEGAKKLPRLLDDPDDGDHVATKKSEGPQKPKHLAGKSGVGKEANLHKAPQTPAPKSEVRKRMNHADSNVTPLEVKQPQQDAPRDQAANSGRPTIQSRHNQRRGKK